MAEELVIICPMTADVTKLIRKAREGSHEAADELYEAIGQELRRVAEAQMRHERASHTLQATALMNEAYIRLAGSAMLDFADRNHFLRTMAQVMRRLLVDHARARDRLKRGGKHGRDVNTVIDEIVAGSTVDLVSLDEAMEQLARLSPRQAELVELRFFGGLTAQEAADLLGISKRTADLDWKMARAFLAGKLTNE